MIHTPVLKEARRVSEVLQVRRESFWQNNSIRNRIGERAVIQDVPRAMNKQSDGMDRSFSLNGNEGYIASRFIQIRIHIVRLRYLHADGTSYNSIAGRIHMLQKLIFIVVAVTLASSATFAQSKSLYTLS